MTCESLRRHRAQIGACQFLQNAATLLLCNKAFKRKLKKQFITEAAAAAAHA